MVCLMMSLVSFSQTDTINKDSLICIPREYVIQTIVDLTFCDFLKEENISLKQDTAELKEIIFYRDFIISRRDEEIKYFQSTLDSCHLTQANLATQYQLTLTKLEETQDKLSTYKKIVAILPISLVSIFIWDKLNN